MIEAIENSAYAIWVRESPSIFAYTSILSLHAIGLAIIVGINTLICFRLLGFVKEIPLAPMRKLFPWMYLGFAVNAFNIILLRNFFESIPRSFEEAARMDGANDFQVLWKVFIPLSKPAIVTITLFCVVSRWNGFFCNPPLCITESELDAAFAIIDRGLEITDRAVLD